MPKLLINNFVRTGVCHSVGSEPQHPSHLHIPNQGAEQSEVQRLQNKVRVEECRHHNGGCERQSECLLPNYDHRFHFLSTSFTIGFFSYCISSSSGTNSGTDSGL